MSRLERKTVTVTATTDGGGGAGDYEGSGSIPVPGGLSRLIGIALDVAAAAPATTDLTVTTKDAIGAAKTIFTRSNNNADVGFTQVKEAFGKPTALTLTTDEGGFVYPIVSGSVDLAVADMNQNDTVILTVVFELLG